MRIFIIGFLIPFLIEGIIQVNYEISEETQIGDLIGHLSSSLSEWNTAHFSYMKLDKDDADYFSVEKETGRLKVAKRLDKEELCSEDSLRNVDIIDSYQTAYRSCKLKFSVNLLNGTNFFNVMKVTISILDADDNSCEFSPSNHQTINIREDVEIRSKFPINSPIDKDSSQENSIQKNSIKIVSENGVASLQNFNLHITPTNIKNKPYNLDLVLIGKLDYEQVKNFKIIIEAKDGSSGNEDHTCRLKVDVNVIDVNEYSPKFRMMDSSLRLFENASMNDPFFKVEAYDLDGGEIFGKIVYEIDPVLSRQSIEEYFRINEETGELFLKKSLNRKQGVTFEIPLVVKNPGDSKLKDTFTLKVEVDDINDESPQISLSRLDGGSELFIEEESTKLPSVFATVTVTDGDTGLNGIVDCYLDEDNQDKFTLQLITEPSYSTYSKKSVDMIYKLSAIRSFDREKDPSVIFQIICSDKGEPSLTTRQDVTVKIIDINDNKPKFQKDRYEFRVNEDSDPKRVENNYEIGRIEAIDADQGKNAELTYSISTEQNVQSFLTIEKNTGIIRSNKNLNREVKDTFQFIVIVKDQGSPSRNNSVDVLLRVIDYNDETPTFNQKYYDFFIKESSATGELVGSLTAEDRDIGLNGKLELSLISGSCDMWKIQNGDSLQDGSLPFKLNSFYDTASKNYRINILVSSIIDREKLISNEESSINSYQFDSYERDFWKNQLAKSYNFCIEAKDMGNPALKSRAPVKVTILDVNDCYPEFNFPNAKEDSVNMSRIENQGYRIAKISATDNDAGDNGTVRFNIEKINTFKAIVEENREIINLVPISPGFGVDLNEYFDLNPLYGDLKLRARLPSSIQVETVFMIRLKASDGGSPPKVTETDLKIFIDDSEPKIIDSTGSWSYLGTSSMLNFVIIITIVAASCLISVILMTAIFVVLRKSKSFRNQTLANGDPHSQMGGNQIYYDSKTDKYQEGITYGGLKPVTFQTGTFARGTPMGNYNFDEIIYGGSKNGTIIRSPTMSTYQNQSYPFIQTTGSNHFDDNSGVNSFMAPISLNEVRLDSNFYSNLMESERLVNESRHDNYPTPLIYNSNSFMDPNLQYQQNDIVGNSTSVSADGDSGHGDSLDTIQNQVHRPLHDVKAVPIYFQTINTITSSTGHEQKL